MKDHQFIHQTNEALLRCTLVVNASFSATFGLLFIATSSTATELLFAQPIFLWGFTAVEMVFGTGIGLLLFAVFVFVVARPNTLKVGFAKLICIMDLGWVAGSVLLVVLYGDYLSPIGVKFVVATAILVALFALVQFVGIASLYQGRNVIEVFLRGDQLVVTAKARTSASPERVWQVLSDLEAYADVADNLSNVEVVEGQGEGLIRRCTDTANKSWTEICTSWVDGESYAFRINTDAVDYPYPIAELTGEWSLAPCVAGTEISMLFEARVKSGIINSILFWLMSRAFLKVCDRLLMKWCSVMEGRSNAHSAATTKVSLAAARS